MGVCRWIVPIRIALAPPGWHLFPMRTPPDALAAALGPHPDPALAPLERLSPEARAELSRLVADARERQRREVKQAIDASLDHVPALLRGTIRKLLF